MAQTQKIIGTVVDDLGEPIIGANIRVKGTTNGTITDLDGKFSLDAAAGSTLEISFVGYATQTVKAAAGMTVTLKEDNYAWKKMKTGSHTVTLTGLCPDGAIVTADFPIQCDVITNALERFYIFGDPEKGQAPFKSGAWDAAAMRFSDNEGKFVDINGNEGFLPYLSDDVYWGFKTLIFDITEATPDCAGRIMNGWWSARYDGDKDVQFTNGQWELPLTEAIAKDCARGNGGDGKDLDLMVTSGSCQINAVYYEE